MFDHDANSSEKVSQPKLESVGDGAGKPPRNTALGADFGPNPQPWLAFSQSNLSRKMTLASIHDLLQMQENADFELMVIARRYLSQKLENSFYPANLEKQVQKFRLLSSWNAWCYSSTGKKAQGKIESYSAESWDKLNYYQMLQVLPAAEIGIISAVYEALNRRYHQDNFATRNDKKFESINEAWAILSRRSTRQAYDESLKAKGLDF